MENLFKTHLINLKRDNLFNNINNKSLDLFWLNLEKNNCYILEIMGKILNNLNILDTSLLKLGCILEVIIYCTKLYLLENNDNSIELMILNIISYSLSQLVNLYDNSIVKLLIQKLNIINYIKTLVPNKLEDINISNIYVYKRYYRELILLVIKTILMHNNLNINMTNYYFYKYFDEKYLNI